MCQWSVSIHALVSSLTSLISFWFIWYSTIEQRLSALTVLCFYILKIPNAYEIIYSTNLGAIIGGVVGGLVVLGVIMKLLFSQRRRRKRETEELYQEPKPVILDSSLMEETVPYPSLPLSNTHTAQLPTTIPDHHNHLSELPWEIHPLYSQDNIQTEPIESKQTPTTLDPSLHSVAVASSSATTAVQPTHEPIASKQTFTTLAPSPRSVGVAPSIATTSVQPTHEPMASAANAQENPSNYELTDQQADLVNGLWKANVSARDIARVIARMRAGESVGDNGSQVDEMNGEIHPNIAPPSYDGVGS
jgi:hypothetical protein